MKPYEKLAFLYQTDWGDFSLGYLKLIKHIKTKFQFNPKSILDIACGTGNLVSRLQNEGYEVIGSDISPEMIEVAKTIDPSVEFIVCDMSELNIQSTFDLIVCPFDSFNYLIEDEQVDSTITQVHKHLNEGGFFVFDVNTPNLFEKKHHGSFERESEGTTFKQTARYNPKNKMAITIFEFEGGTKEEHIQRGYTKDEISEKLTSCGFKIKATYEDLDFHKANSKSERVFFVTKKAK